MLTTSVQVTTAKRWAEDENKVINFNAKLKEKIMSDSGFLLLLKRLLYNKYPRSRIILNIHHSILLQNHNREWSMEERTISQQNSALGVQRDAIALSLALFDLSI